jgi:hypothetical protein
MSETKFTPGPWKTWGSCVFGDTGTVCACGEPRATSTAEYTPLEYGSKDRAEAHANAQLIASAPDLLAACQFAYQSLLDGDIDHAEIVAVLEVAIEKALGLQAEVV